MNTTTELIILAIVMSLLGSYSLYGAKKLGQDPTAFRYLCALLGYALIILILAHLSKTRKISNINSVWSAVSICTGIAMGFLAFNEIPSRMEMLGVITIIAGMVLMQL